MVDTIEGIVNVGADYGGKVFLIIGDKKAALIDCDMAYASKSLINNIKENLNHRQLDLVLLSHSHYDHVGGLPYLRNEFRQLKALGAAYAFDVLKKPTARIMIKQLSQSAADQLDADNGHITIINYDDELLYLDGVLNDNDIISLGNTTIKVISTPGHTRCSLSFYLIEKNVLFASETTGALIEYGKLCPEFLTGYKDTIDSIEKCRQKNAKYVFLPHYGLINPADSQNYWNWALEAAKKGKEIILDMLDNSMEEEEIIEAFEKEFYKGYLVKMQPAEAFRINAANSIKVIKREFKQES